MPPGYELKLVQLRWEVLKISFEAMEKDDEKKNRTFLIKNYLQLSGHKWKTNVLHAFLEGNWVTRNWSDFFGKRNYKIAFFSKNQQ